MVRARCYDSHIYSTPRTRKTSPLLPSGNSYITPPPFHSLPYDKQYTLYTKKKFLPGPFCIKTYTNFGSLNGSAGKAKINVDIYIYIYIYIDLDSFHL